MSFDYERYLRLEHLPHLWCPGCSHGVVTKALLRAIDKQGLDQDKVVVVSGIGCASRLPGYVDFCTLHTTHGRALPFATGIKLARPELHVIVVSGDGDALAIGGNHFIHACRRNIDLTLVIFNNSIYGMTGGQYSPTTPHGAISSTTPFGNPDSAFDAVELAKAAGATYVARTTAHHVRQMDKLISDGIGHAGFAVIETLGICYTNYGRRNRKRYRSNQDMLRELKERTVTATKAETMSAEELDRRWVVGLLHREERPVYTECCEERTGGARQPPEK